MTSFFLNVSFSDVKKLGIGLVLALLSGPAFAQQINVGQNCSIPQPSCPSGQIAKASETFPDGHNCAGFPKAYRCEADCETYSKEVQEAQGKAASKCSQASLGSFPQCLEKMKKCMDSSTAIATEPDLMTQMLPFAGQLSSQFLGSDPFSSITNNGAAKKPVGECPNMSSRDYFEQKDRIQREIDSKNKEAADLQKEMADATKDFNEQKKQLTDDANEAQKEMNEQLLDVSKEQREVNAELTKTQNETAEQIRQLNTQLMSKRAEMVRSEAAFTQKLSAMTETMGQSQCLLKVQEERAKLQKAGVFGTSGGGVGAFGRQSSKMKALQEMFDLCLKDFRMQRLALQEERSSYMKMAQNDIANLQENISEANQALESVGKQVQQALSDLETAKNNKMSEAIKASQAAQQALADAATGLQERQKAIAAQQASFTASINTLNQDLANLGPAPASGSTNGWREAQEALIEYRSKIVSVPESCKGTAVKASSSEIRKLDKLIQGSGSSGRK